jgi:hypothetical protein
LLATGVRVILWRLANNFSLALRRCR